ncbi:MAG: alpha/beta hydrolase [Sphingobacteriales bacterium]|nr:alpha/beta hydrolase [Sphingobacteriales bacterium]MBI3718561.1 alpha/beta hydrolase [Sphingobacteriales bacterium]
MKKYLLAILLQLIIVAVTAQYTVNVIVNAPATNENIIYLAGSFNDWDPASADFQLSKNSKGQYELQITNAPSGSYEFKFTRGSWANVECDKNGKDITNRSVTIQSDTTLEYTVAGWKDAYSSAEIKHTACSNVKIIDTAFAIPQLNRTRRIWIYLPEGYETSKTKYPVLYMQDAQNVFDAATSFAGEWGVDETLDSLIKKGTRACIVVGIDNGGDKRLSEYSPYDFEWKGNGSSSLSVKGEGDAYVDFMANTLKPFIDKNYRTRKEKESTMIAGSSMGGLISYYALVRYPNVFGEAGIFSPAFWVLPGLDKLMDEATHKVNAKVFFYAGEQESESMVPLMDSVADKLGSSTPSIIYKIVDPEGKHNEPTWRRWFPEFYQWIIGEGYDGKIKAE